MLSVGSIVGGTLRLIRERPGTVAIWALAYLGGSILISLLSIAGALSMASGMASVMEHGGDPEAMDAVMRETVGGSSLLLQLLQWGLSIFLQAVLITAVCRAVLRPGDTAFASMRVSMDEMRTFGVLFILTLLSLAVVALVVLFAIFLSAMIGFASRGDMATAAGLGIVFGLVGMAGYIYLAVRLSLVLPASFQAGRVTLDTGWEMTRGRVWTLLGGYFCLSLIALLALLVALLPMFGAIGTLASVMGSGGGPAALQPNPMLGGQAMAGILLSCLLLVLLSPLLVVLGYAGPAVALRNILEEAEEY